MSREAFLTRVRQAAAAGRAYRIEPRGEVTANTGYVGGGDDPCATFATELSEVGGVTHLVANLDAARDTLARLLRAATAREPGEQAAICWKHELLDRVDLGAMLADLKITRLDGDDLDRRPRDEQRRAALAACVGITSADFAIAETGSLVMCARPGQERFASLLPPVHIAIIERRQLLPDLFDVFARLGESVAAGLPSNVVLITGPSKTGDIELQLTTGVHGPGEVHVILVTD